MTTPPKLARSFTRHGFLTFLYLALFFFSLWLSYQLRFDFDVPAHYASQFLVACLWILPLKLLCLYFFGQFDGLLSYFSVPDLKRIVAAVGAGSIDRFFVRALEVASLGPPRGVILSDFIISIAGICTLRLGLRTVPRALSRSPNGTAAAPAPRSHHGRGRCWRSSCARAYDEAVAGNPACRIPGRSEMAEEHRAWASCARATGIPAR